MNHLLKTKQHSENKKYGMRVSVPLLKLCEKLLPHTKFHWNGVIGCWLDRKSYVHGLSNLAIFNDLERPQTQTSRSGHSLRLNISEMAKDTAIITMEGKWAILLNAENQLHELNHSVAPQVYSVYIRDYIGRSHKQYAPVHQFMLSSTNFCIFLPRVPSSALPASQSVIFGYVLS